MASNALISITYTILVTCAGIYPKNESSMYFEALSTAFNDNGTALLKSVIGIGGFLMIFLNLLTCDRNKELAIFYYIIFFGLVLAKLPITFFNLERKVSPLSLTFLILPLIGFSIMGFGKSSDGVKAFFKDLNEKKKNIYVLSLITNYNLTTFCLQLFFAGAEALLCFKFSFIYNSNTFYAKHIENLILDVGNLVELQNGFLIIMVVVMGIAGGLIFNFCVDCNEMYSTTTTTHKKITSKFCPKPAIFSCVITFFQFHFYSWNCNLGNWDYIFKGLHLILMMVHFICYWNNREDIVNKTNDDEYEDLEDNDTHDDLKIWEEENDRTVHKRKQ